MFNKLPTLILIVYLCCTVASQFSECVAPNDLFNYDHFELSEDSFFDSRHFLGSTFPDWEKIEKYNYAVAGSGSYGVVLGIEMKDKQLGTKFHIGLKIMEYRADRIERTSNEIKLNKELSWANPLAAPVFIGCANDSSKRRLFINSEFMEGTINLRDFSDKIRSNRQLTEQFNLMARALSNLHAMGYCHNDVKHENFMFKDESDGKPIITKLIDFGIATEIGTDKFGGTPDTIAPERCVSPYKTLTASDNYSLGIVFYTMLYGTSHIFFKDDAEFDDNSSRKARFKKRHKQINKKLTEIENNADPNDERANDFITALHQVIRSLTNENAGQRMELTEVIQTFDDVLRKYNPNSLYLTENAKLLFKAVYPSSEYNYVRYSKPASAPSQSFNLAGAFASMFSCGQKTKKPEKKVFAPIPVFNYPDQRNRRMQTGVPDW